MKQKSILAMLLCLCMVLSACGSGAAGFLIGRLRAASGAEAVSERPAETPSPVNAEETSAVSAEEPVMQSDDLFIDVELPLSDAVETLTMWWGGFDGGNFGNDNPGVTLISQAAQEATNVEIDYSFCSGMDFIEQTALMFASGDWPDMIKGPSLYTGGLVRRCGRGRFPGAERRHG